jgi:prolyl oligopeptidase PreP (S9A serine peptidase family)
MMLIIIYRQSTIYCEHFINDSIIIIAYVIRDTSNYHHKYVLWQSYPSLLVTAGLHDPRVAYWEPAKWVAKLREMKTDSNLLLFKTDLSSGHFSASDR